MHSTAISEENLPNIFEKFSNTLEQLKDLYPNDRDIVGLWDDWRICLAFTPKLVTQLQKYYESQLKGASQNLAALFSPSYPPAFMAMSKLISQEILMQDGTQPKPLPAQTIKDICSQITETLQAKYAKHSLERQHADRRYIVKI